MWRSGRPETEDTAIFSQGYPILSARVRRDHTVIKRNIATLIEKLTIQVVRPATTSAQTVYRVFSYRETLNRRRTAGLIWVQRHGVAIHFVLPPSQRTRPAHRRVAYRQLVQRPRPAERRLAYRQPRLAYRRVTHPY